MANKKKAEAVVIEQPPHQEIAHTAAPTLSKTDMIRQAIAAGQVTPTAGTNWIREQFGVTLPTNLFSTTKYSLERRAKSNTRVVSRPNTPAVDPVELVRQVKQLVNKFGAEQVRSMIEVLSE